MLNIESQKIFLEALANREGIQVVFDEDCKVPTATALGVITLPPPSPEIMDKWLYSAHHEISHLFPENLWTYKYLTLVKDEFEAIVANSLVDYIAERSKWGYYAGRDEIMDSGYTSGIKDIISSLPPERSPELDLLCGIIMQTTEGRKDWPHTPNTKTIDIPWYHTEPEIKEFSDKLEALDMIPRLNDCNTVVKLHDLVKDILELIDRESSVSDEQAEGADSGEGEAGEGEAGEGEAGEGEAGEGEAGEGEGEKPSGKKRGDNEGTGVIPDEMKPRELQYSDDHDEQDREAIFGSRRYTPHTNHKIIDLSVGRSNTEGSYLRRITDTFNASTLTKQIRKHLMAISQSRYEGGKRRGKLSVSSISKLYTSDRPTMFKQKIGTQIKADTTVSLLIDFSGSMSGSKYTTASASAISVASILTALRIKHEILGFSEARGLVSYIVKPYNEGMGVSDGELIERFSDRRIDLNNNADGESLVWCAGRLMERSEKNKVMMVFSDGYPCGSYSGDGTWYLKEMCQEIEQRSPIYLTGIGIESSSVEKFYSNCSVINDISQLNKAVLGTLQDNILK